jgi:hypothetical protein
MLKLKAKSESGLPDIKSARPNENDSHLAPGENDSHLGMVIKYLLRLSAKLARFCCQFHELGCPFP